LAERRADIQAIGLTKGGRNSKVHALVAKLCPAWVLILTHPPGNTAAARLAFSAVSPVKRGSVPSLA
jgi:hypothetical protein